MRVEVFFTPGEQYAGVLADHAVVVIDVLRATSTMVEALANGARAVFPVTTADEAVRIAQNIGRDQALLCGERRSVRIEGFDLGNSPLEFTAERVSGRPLVMTTTNGTAAMATVAAAKSVLIASLLNVSAVAAELAAEGGPVAIVCAGRERRFALEDAVCAGALIRGVHERVGGTRRWNDAAAASVQLARRHLARIDATLRRTSAGRQLIEQGFGADLAFCGQVDRYDLVPRFRDRQVTLS